MWIFTSASIALIIVDDLFKDNIEYFGYIFTCFCTTLNITIPQPNLFQHSLQLLLKCPIPPIALIAHKYNREIPGSVLGDVVQPVDYAGQTLRFREVEHQQDPVLEIK